MVLRVIWINSPSFHYVRAISKFFQWNEGLLIQNHPKKTMLFLVNYLNNQSDTNTQYMLSESQFCVSERHSIIVKK